MTARPDAPTPPMTAAGQALASPPCSRFRCIVADPPWPLSMRGKRKRAKEPKLPDALPYPTMTMDEICAMPIGELAAEDCHLWLWTTNQHLNDGFRVMREWGFRYLVPIHWIKPSGVGNWFIHRTQTILFGYREKCRFPAARYLPNILETSDPKRHSQKPEESYRLVESVSPGPRLELFARTVRPGWSAWGNEVPCDVQIDTSNAQGQARREATLPAPPCSASSES